MSQYSPSLPWSPYETMTGFPTQWNNTSPQSEQQIVDYYNTILDNQMHRSTSTASTAYTQSPHSSTGYRTPPASAPHSRTPSFSQPQPMPTSHHRKSPSSPSNPKEDRRREQNRASQRAYRERKEKQLKALEVQIAQWQAKHQTLSKSYSSQSEEVRQLKKRIEELTGRIISVQTGLLEGSGPEQWGDFDMGLGFGWNGA